jgi:D-lyxose ketol-isomerase
MTTINNLISLSGIFLSDSEIENIEQTDFGLQDFENIGLSIHTYINTERCCAKELFLLPYQTCPEHQHPSTTVSIGKEETFRCRYGKVSIFIEGPLTTDPEVRPPKNGEQYYTAFHEITLEKGGQLTLMPDTRHWFQAHENGAVVSEFSTQSNDLTDIFTDVRIKRASYIFPLV